MSFASRAIPILGRRLWHPNDLALGKLLAWWDADFGTTIVSGFVSDWRDKIGGITVSQVTATARPGIGGLGGQRALTFDGADDSLTNAVVALATGSSENSLYILGSQDEAAGVGGIRVAISYGNVANNRAVYRSATNNNTALSTGTGGYGTTNQWTGAHLAGGQFGPGNVGAVRFDGGPGSPAAAAFTLNTAGTQLRIGGYSTNGQFHKGTIRHALITGVLTTDERQRLEAWMMWDVGLQGNIEASNPYKNVRP